MPSGTCVGTNAARMARNIGASDTVVGQAGGQLEGSHGVGRPIGDQAGGHGRQHGLHARAARAGGTLRKPRRPRPRPSRRCSPPASSGRRGPETGLGTPGRCWPRPRSQRGRSPGPPVRCRRGANSFRSRAAGTGMQETTNTAEPTRATSGSQAGSAARRRLIVRSPQASGGRATRNHSPAQGAGRMPSVMCIARRLPTIPFLPRLLPAARPGRSGRRRPPHCRPADRRS